MQLKNSVCFVAGKSGGHIIPALTLARQYKSQVPGTSITFFSTGSSLDQRIISHNASVDVHIPLNFDRRSSSLFQSIKLPLLFVSSFCRAFLQFVRNRPQSVISMGGLVSIPVVIAAWILRIPVTLYELNAIPGKAVKMLSFFSQTVCICFEGVRSYFPSHKIKKINYPIRFVFEKQFHKSEARQKLGLAYDNIVLLVLGGSQGSRYLNTFAESYIRYRVASQDSSKLVVIHQTGEHDVQSIENFYHSLGLKAYVFDFCEDLSAYYAVADVAIARAGAGTIFELQFFEVQTLLIPLEVKYTDHQLDNAYAIAAQRGDLFGVARQSAIENNADLAYRYLDQRLC